MTQKDYSKNLATARRLVQKFGRQVTLVKLKQTSSDSAKPWQAPTDARSAPDVSTVVSAAAVPPSSETALGLTARAPEIAKQVEQILIMEPSTSDTLVEDHNLVIDQGKEFKILDIEKLQPAGVALLYYVWIGQ